MLYSKSKNVKKDIGEVLHGNEHMSIKITISIVEQLGLLAVTKSRVGVEGGRIMSILEYQRNHHIK